MSDPSKLSVLDKAHSLLECVNEAVTKVRQPHLDDLKTQDRYGALSHLQLGTRCGRRSRAGERSKTARKIQTYSLDSSTGAYFIW
jgi:hypothetical protein